jgi:hypothetical protein
MNFHLILSMPVLRSPIFLNTAGVRSNESEKNLEGLIEIDHCHLLMTCNLVNDRNYWLTFFTAWASVVDGSSNFLASWPSYLDFSSTVFALLIHITILSSVLNVIILENYILL